MLVDKLSKLLIEGPYANESTNSDAQIKVRKDELETHCKMVLRKKCDKDKHLLALIDQKFPYKKKDSEV